MKFFEAKRLYVNTINDLSIAYAKTKYQTGTLLTSLGVTRYANDEASLSIDTSGYESAACPAEAPEEYKPNHDKLDALASELLAVPKKR